MSFAGLQNLRVALVGPLPPPSGGMANQTRQLAELLASVGVAVTLVQVNSPYRPGWIAKVPVLRSAFRLIPYLIALWRAAGRADVFHIMANSGWSWHLFAAPAIWVARCRGVGAVVNYRGGEAAEFLQRGSRLFCFTMRKARALIVPSGFLQSVFARYALQAIVVPNIIDLGRFRPRNPVRSEAPHLLVARNLEPLYDNETAIRAFSLVRAHVPQARLTIAGSGPDEQRLRQWVQDQGLVDVVKFTGRLDRDAMATLYRSADLLLNPSLADNMPNSILEAWASGVPVVSTNVGGIPFMTQDGITASLVPPSDPAAMARACLSLLANPVLWTQRASAGLQEAQRYTWLCVQPVLADVYRQAIQPKR